MRSVIKWLLMTAYCREYVSFSATQHLFNLLRLREA